MTTMMTNVSEGDVDHLLVEPVVMIAGDEGVAGERGPDDEDEGEGDDDEEAGGEGPEGDDDVEGEDRHSSDGRRGTGPIHHRRREDVGTSQQHL